MSAWSTPAFPTRQTAVLTAALGWLLTSWPARADAIDLGVAPPQSIFVVVGFEGEDRRYPELRTAAAEAIEAEADAVARTPELPPEKLQCRDSRCVEQMVKDFHADYLLGGKVSRDPQSQRFVVEVWLYKVHERDPKRRRPGWRLTCDDCDSSIPERRETARRRHVRDIVVKLLLREQLSRSMRPVRLNHQQTCPPYRTFLRGLGIGAAGGLGVASLIAGGALQYVQGSTPIQASSPDPSRMSAATLRSRDTEYPEILFGAGALGLLLTGLALVPWRGELNSSTAACIPAPSSPRWTFVRGLAVGVSGSMLLASTASLAALGWAQANPESVCQNVKPPFSCSFGGQLTGAGVAAGAWALTLGLSILIPSS